MNAELHRAHDDSSADGGAPLFTAPSSDGDPKCDLHLLFMIRFLRLFAFGCCTVVLLLLLEAAGLEGSQIGTLLSGTMVGDLFITLLLTTSADGCGRKRVLIAGAGLAVLGSIALSSTTDFTILLIACTVGVISPAGGEVGPFLAVEQAALAGLTSQDGGVAAIAEQYGRYQAVGEVAKALGSLTGGHIVQAASATGTPTLNALRIPVYIFGALSLGKAALYTRLSPKIEAPPAHPRGGASKGGAGLHDMAARLPCAASLSPGSRGVVVRLSGLFAVDAFAGGFTMLTFLAFWFRTRWGLPFGALGGILAGVNVVAGLSGMLAGRMVARFGAIETMVYTHLPSNVLLILVPLMPSAEAAAAMLILRFTISQMDVPARQAYVVWQVRAEERSAAGGLTSIARSLGLSLSPLLLGSFTTAPAGSVRLDCPFYIAGGLKILYDLAVWRHFRTGQGHGQPDEDADDIL